MKIASRRMQWLICEGNADEKWQPKEPHSEDLSEIPPLRIVIDVSLPPLEQLMYMYHLSQSWVAQTGHQQPVMTWSTIIRTIENENLYFRLTKLNHTFLQSHSTCMIVMSKRYVCSNLTAHSTLNMTAATWEQLSPSLLSGKIEHTA